MPKNTAQEVKIRDLRKKEKYQVDDAYLNGFARICGWQATLVYNSLCRHADRDQYSFPSIEQMSRQHGVSRPTIIKGVSALAEHNLIVVTKKRSGKGRFINNGYVLLDRSQWTKNLQKASEKSKTQVNDVDMDQPRVQVNDVDCKDTHIIKDTHYQYEANASDDKSNVDKLLINHLKSKDNIQYEFQYHAQ